MTSHDPIIAEFRNNVKDITHTKESLTDPRGACIQGCYQCEKDKKVIDLFIKALTQAEARGYERGRKDSYCEYCQCAICPNKRARTV